MSHILYGAPVAALLHQHVREYISTCDATESPLGYLAIFVVGDNNPSLIYVRSKKKVAEELGVDIRIIPCTLDTIVSHIHDANTDTSCLAIIVQLPLPGCADELKHDILAVIDPRKDVDNLTGKAGLLGATPAAALAVIDYYGYGEMAGRHVAIVGQSDLIGKPLKKACELRGASVFACDISTPDSDVREGCQNADIIFSATGHVHLLDKEYIRHDHTQIVVDIGWGTLDGKAVGDVNIPSIVDHVQAYTPVPGGVGPVTVAQIFVNMVFMDAMKHAELLSEKD